MITNTLIVGTGAVATARQIATDAAVARIAHAAKLRRSKVTIDARQVTGTARVVGITVAELCCAVANTVAGTRRRAGAQRDRAVDAGPAVVTRAHAGSNVALA